jgi:hypothetical protein
MKTPLSRKYFLLLATPKTYEPYTDDLNGMPGSGQTEKGETSEEQIQDHPHHFL